MASPPGKRIAIFNEPIVGTVNPTLPIVAELVTQGCDVRYYTADLGMRDVIEEAGATCEHFDDYLGRWEKLIAEEAEWLEHHGLSVKLASTPPYGHLMHLNMAFYSLPAGLCLANRMLQRWEAPNAWRPDMVIHSCQAVYGMLLASKLWLPVASFMTWPGPGVPMQLACLASEEERTSFDAGLAKEPVLVQANSISVKEFGVDVTGTQLACRHFNSKLNLVLSVPALGAQPSRHQEALIDSSTFKWVGYTGNQALHVNGARPTSALLEHETDITPWKAPEGVKVLLVTLGSRTVGVLWNQPFHISSSRRYTGKEFSQKVWTELIHQFGGRPDVQVVLGIGPHEDALEGITLPSNVAAMRCIPQIEALACSDVFVTHGGANSVMEGHLAGIPMIVLPFCVDQHSNGEAVQHAGAGSVLPLLMEEPHGALGAVAEDALFGELGQRQRVHSREIGNQLRAAGGAQAAAEACLGLLKPDLRTAAAGA